MQIGGNLKKLKPVKRRTVMFYDGYCPLCVSEVRQLSELDKKGTLDFEDVNSLDFQSRFPYIDAEAAYKKLHVQCPDGKLVYGLDATVKVWTLVGKHRWLKILRWPIIRWIADGAYMMFARYRYFISFLYTGQSRCTTDAETATGNACQLSDETEKTSA